MVIVDLKILDEGCQETHLKQSRCMSPLGSDLSVRIILSENGTLS